MPQYSDGLKQAVRRTMADRNWSTRDAEATTGISQGTINEMAQRGYIPSSGTITDWAIAIGEDINHWRRLAGYKPIPPELVSDDGTAYVPPKCGPSTEQCIEAIEGILAKLVEDAREQIRDLDK